MVDQLARELGADPSGDSAPQLHPPDAFPYQSPLFVYDSGNYEHNMDKALSIVGYEGLRRRRVC
jgi:carbon-monoxide dehydrogenase large subunit